MQHIADAVQKGLQIFVRVSFQQGRARLTRLRNEFHAVLAWSCGRAKCQCSAPTVTVVVYTVIEGSKSNFEVPVFSCSLQILTLSLISQSAENHDEIVCLKCRKFKVQIWDWTKRLKSLSSALLISRYILGLGQRGRCCFCTACPDHKMYLEIRSANEEPSREKCTRFTEATFLRALKYYTMSFVKTLKAFGWAKRRLFLFG